MQCPKFKQQSVITSKRYEIKCQLLLITDRKSHMVFQLVLTMMTLNGVITLILPNSMALQAYYITVVEDRPILSAHPAALVSLR